MNYNLKSFKRYMKEYDGQYLTSECNGIVLDRIYEMASDVREINEVFNEANGMYETECIAIWEEKIGELHSFVFTKGVPYEKVDKEVFDINEDGNTYLKGYRSHLDGSFIEV